MILQKLFRVPCIVLSGLPSDDTELLLTFVRDAVDCGVAGVSMGRNVWIYKDPASFVCAVIVYKDVFVEEVLKELAN